MKLTDEELMTQISSGNQKAFSSIVRRYLDFSIRYLRKRGCFSPEDISQETFLKVWRHAKRYSSKKSLFKTWFFRILRNEYIEFKRKNKRHEANLNIDFLDLGHSKTPELIFELNQKKEKIYKQINHLSLKLKEVFLLKYLDDLKAQEIALFLGIELKAVESRLLRAKKKIQEGKNEKH